MADAVLSQGTPPAVRSTGRVVGLFWAATIFLSAFLLFQVQPILAKIISPWFGGGAGVWTASLMFFQVTYLCGNLYAHWLIGRAGPSLQSRVHIFLLAGSLFLLPIFPNAFWKPQGGADPTLRIIGLLAATVGLPFLILSATSPVLQAWYVRERSRRGGVPAEPYRFYALSNAGSLLGLLSYPVLVEPHSSTRHQVLGWSAAYVGFAALCAWIAWRRRTAPACPRPPGNSIAAKPDWALQLLWLALAADASALLLSITTHLSQNVAAVPLLWVVPLALYLLSLILCFEGRGWYRRPFFLRLLAVAVGGMAYALSPEFANIGPVVQVPLFCGSLFVCCMVCHGELAKLKPSPEHLTLFYLMVSAGGAVGGIFVGVIAPRVFRGFYELPLAMALLAVLLLIVLYRESTEQIWRQPLFLVSAGLTGLLVISLVYVTVQQGQSARVMVRNFYGVLRVADFEATSDQPARRQLFNGAIIHGLEILSADRRMQPTTYYSPRSGAGLALAALHSQGSIRAGIIGLGAGTLAAYGQPGDHYTFYELNPLVIDLANTQFGFLRGSKAEIQIVPGDARLSLEREPPQGFDILLVDAFSGDAIPVHLLTREAFELYFRHLEPQGLLAIHISNRFLDLRPVVEAAARSLGFEATAVTNSGDPQSEIYTATWMLVSRQPLSQELPSIPTQTQAADPRRVRLWTDDYSNLLQILK